MPWLTVKTYEKSALHQGLKLTFFCGVFGTTEVVPCYKALMTCALGISDAFG